MFDAEGQVTLQNWLVLVTDVEDGQPESAFERELAHLLGDATLSDEDQWRIATGLEQCILTCDVQPTERQLARFWLLRARQYLRQSQFMQGFEALTLCERNLAPEETAMVLYVHSLMVNLALQQGHYIQSLMSSTTVTSSIQELVPRFIAVQQQQELFFLEGTDEVRALINGAYVGEAYRMPS